MLDTISFLMKAKRIAASGFVGAKEAEELCHLIGGGESLTIDFSAVSGVNFAAQRAFLRARKSGLKFNIVNASPEIAGQFEDSGVASFVNVCRRSEPLDMSIYEEFGASYMSKAYNSADGNSMIKVYGPRVPVEAVEREKVVARAVMRFGIATPLVGSLYSDGQNNALSFERIEGKRSFSRIISEEPDRLEEITRRFAVMCKELHSTECDTAIFSDRSLFYRSFVEADTVLGPEVRARALAFLDGVPSATTCLHGDMQLSNVITNGNEDMWIDLGDFSYGNHMFDMGMWYFLCKLNNEEHALSLFHLHKADLDRIWDIFIEEYFGLHDPESIKAVTSEIEPFAALHMIYLGTAYRYEPWMPEYIKRIFK